MDFQYRKAFGLTEEEFRREPLEIYLKNALILSVSAKLEREAMEEAERKSKV